MDARAICATKGGEKVSDSGALEAGFPPTQMPDETYPLCQIAYKVPSEWGPWAEVRFDVDDLCLKGMKGERKCSAFRTFSAQIISSHTDSIELQVSRAATRRTCIKEMFFPVLISSRMKARA